jgi:hypothetical protein
MGRAARRRLQGADDDRLDLVVTDLPRPRPGFVVQPVEPIVQKARLPLAHRRRGDVQAFGDTLGRSAPQRMRG